MLSFANIIIVAAAVAAVTTRAAPAQLEGSSADQPTTCIPASCSRNGSVVCHEDQQYCSTESNNSSSIGQSLGRPCRNETVSPAYPITEACRDTALAPYNKEAIPKECLNTMCANLDGSSRGLWCLYHPDGWTGLTYKKLGMECAP